MKKRLKRIGLIGVIVYAGLIIAGCASTSTSTLYDTPNWMPDGRIICGKLVVTSSQQFYGGGISESKGYMAAFYPSGTGEVNLFEAGALYQTTCSPTDELIAAVSPYYNGVNYAIVIYDYKGNISQVPNTSNVQYLDWSPDATKLVYSDSDRNLYIINRDGTGKTQIATSAEAVAWRVGNRIILEYVVGTSSSRIYAIDADGNNQKDLAQGVMPQSTNNQRVVYRSGGIPKSINVNGTDEVTLFGDYDRDTLKLSFDNTKIVGGKTGDSGIWLMNIDGTGYEKIR